MNTPKINKQTNITLIIIFGLIIYIPLIVGVIQKDKLTSQVEKRNLTVIPSIPKNFSELNKFPSTFNLYYADHFGLREFLTKTYFKIINKINTSSTSPDVTFGIEDWMFLGSITPGYTANGDPMGDVTNANPYTEEELKKFSHSLSMTKRWLEKQGIEYIYIVAPLKHTIYFDKLPKYISKINKYSAMDQLLSYLNTHTDIKTIDLRKALSIAKKNQQLYYKTDSHWNYNGANIAQFEIIKVIEDIFPGKVSAKLHSPSQFKLSQFTRGDLAQLANIERSENDPRPIFNNSCPESNTAMEFEGVQSFTTNCPSKKLNALIFRDSFTTALQPFFSRKFKHATYIQDRLNIKSLRHYIAIQKPDIVIDEIIERTLPYLPTDVDMTELVE